MSRLRRTTFLLVGCVVAGGLIALDRDGDQGTVMTGIPETAAHDVRERIPEVTTSTPVPMPRAQVAEPWQSKLGETPGAPDPTVPLPAPSLRLDREDHKLVPAPKF